MITFKVPSGELSAMLQSIARAIPPTHTNPIMTEFLFRIKNSVLYVTGGSGVFQITDSIAISAEGDMEDCYFSVNPSDIVDYVKDLPEQPLTFQFNGSCSATAKEEGDTDNGFGYDAGDTGGSGEGQLTILFDEGEFSFSVSVSDQFNAIDTPEDKKVDSFSLDVAMLSKGLEYTAASLDGNAPHASFAGVHFAFFPDRLEMVATNGFVLTLYTVQGSFLPGADQSKSTSFTLPEATASYLKSFLPRYLGEEVMITRYEKSIKLNLATVELISTLNELSFPAYHTIIPQDIEYELELDTAVLMGKVRRVNKFMKDEGGVVFTPNNDKIQILARAEATNRQAKEQILVNNPKNFSMPFELNNMRFQKLLGNIESDTVLIQIKDITRSFMVVPGNMPEGTSLINIISAINNPNS